MAKATLEFDLNDPDDSILHLRYIKSTDILLALHEFDQHLRSESKYRDNEEAEKLREKFWEILGDNNISIDELLK